MAAIKYKDENGNWQLLNPILIKEIDVVQTTGTSSADVMSQSAVTESLSNVYTKSEINAMRAPSYNPTTKTMVFPATSTFTYSADTKTIILSH